MQTAGIDTAHLTALTASLIASLTYLIIDAYDYSLDFLCDADSVHPILSSFFLSIHASYVFIYFFPLHSRAFPGFLLAEKTFADAERRVAAQSRQAALSELFFAQVGYTFGSHMLTSSFMSVLRS